MTSAFSRQSQTMVEVMKIMATSCKRPQACTAALSTPNPAAGHHLPMPPPETPGHSRARLGQSLVGSLLLSPGSWCAQGSVCAHQEFVSQSCVSSGSSMVGLMATSSKRAYAIARSAAPRALPLWQSTAHLYLSIEIMITMLCAYLNLVFRICSMQSTS